MITSASSGFSSFFSNRADLASISVQKEDYLPSEERKILGKMEALEKELQIELDELQKKAVLESIKNGILIFGFSSFFSNRADLASPDTAPFNSNSLCIVFAS